MENEIEKINEELVKNGLAKIAIVDPRELIGMDINARYMEPAILDRLVENIKRDGRLESAPLVCRRGDSYVIISGHHRTHAAILAGLKKIVVFVSESEDEQEIAAKQLSHNSLVGKDDDVVLKSILEKIKDVELRMYAGINDEVSLIKTIGIDFSPSPVKEVVFLFASDNINLDGIIEFLEKDSKISSESEVYTASIRIYEKFAKAIAAAKKAKKVKNGNVIIQKMIEMIENEIIERGRANEKNKTD